MDSRNAWLCVYWGMNWGPLLAPVVCVVYSHTASIRFLQLQLFFQVEDAPHHSFDRIIVLLRNGSSALGEPHSVDKQPQVGEG